MRSLMLLFLMAISAFGANDSAKATLLRVSGGAGAGTFGLMVEGRVLGGAEGSPWRYGVQAMEMAELRLFVTPNENVSSLCFLVGRELIPSGTQSFTAFGGVGIAESELRGKKVSSEMFNTTYKSLHYTDPMLLLGGDLGVSFRRHFGASLQFGLHLSRITTVYTLVQLDVGKW